MKVVNRLAELVAQKQRREDRKITQTTIAEETGLSYGTVSDWMNNRASAYKESTILVLCEWVPCDVSDLLVIEDDESQVRSGYLELQPVEGFAS